MFFENCFDLNLCFRNTSVWKCLLKKQLPLETCLMDSETEKSFNTSPNKLFWKLIEFWKNISEIFYSENIK